MSGMSRICRWVSWSQRKGEKAYMTPPSHAAAQPNLPRRSTKQAARPVAANDDQRRRL